MFNLYLFLPFSCLLCGKTNKKIKVILNECESKGWITSQIQEVSSPYKVSSGSLAHIQCKKSQIAREFRVNNSLGTPNIPHWTYNPSLTPTFVGSRNFLGLTCNVGLRFWCSCLRIQGKAAEGKNAWKREESAKLITLEASTPTEAQHISTSYRVSPDTPSVNQMNKQISTHTYIHIHTLNTPISTREEVVRLHFWATSVNPSIVSMATESKQ